MRLGIILILGQKLERQGVDFSLHQMGEFFIDQAMSLDLG